MIQTKEELIQEWKKLRGKYFNLYEENLEKFEKKYKDHPLYSSVIKHLDKSFRDVNQIAEAEIEKYLQGKDLE